MMELDEAAGADRCLDQAVGQLRDLLARPAELEGMDAAWPRCWPSPLQGSLMVRHGDPNMADAFCITRLAGERGATYCTLPPGPPLGDLIECARPRI